MGMRSFIYLGKKAWSKILVIYTALTFRTKTLPIIGGGRVLVNSEKNKQRKVLVPAAPCLSGVNAAGVVNTLRGL